MWVDLSFCSFCLLFKLLSAWVMAACVKQSFWCLHSLILPLQLWSLTCKWVIQILHNPGAGVLCFSLAFRFVYKCMTIVPTSFLSIYFVCVCGGGVEGRPHFQKQIVVGGNCTKLWLWSAPHWRFSQLYFNFFLLSFFFFFWGGGSWNARYVRWGGGEACLQPSPFIQYHLLLLLLIPVSITILVF